MFYTISDNAQNHQSNKIQNEHDKARKVNTADCICYISQTLKTRVLELTLLNVSFSFLAYVLVDYIPEYKQINLNKIKYGQHYILGT